MNDQPFRRKIYGRMLEWKERSNGRTALLVEGAHGVGKRTVVERFARNEYASCLILDFSRLSGTTRAVFDAGLRGIDDFMMELQISEGIRLVPRESVIVFAEVQEYILARQMIKHLVADGRFDYIETGSMIATVTRVEDAMNPSEEEHIYMYPMDFEEFLWADGDTVTVPYLEEMFGRKEPLGGNFHELFLKLFREYMVIGGMPAAVAAYGKGKDIYAAEEAKRGILEMYSEDMAKMKKLIGRNVGRVFEAVPSMLSRGCRCFSPGMIRKGSCTADYLDAVFCLEESMVIGRCVDCADPQPWFTLGLVDEVMKCFILDTGLLVTMVLGSEEPVKSEVYRELILGKLSVGRGMFFENAVAQQLVASGHELMFSKFESGGRKYEVDFLIAENGKLHPVETRCSAYRNHRAIDEFMGKYGSVSGEGYVIHTGDLVRRDGVTCIPVYMTMFL